MSCLRYSVIWGATGHSKVAREIVEQSGNSVYCIIDNITRLASPSVDIPLFYGEKGLEHVSSKLKLMGLNLADVDCIAVIGGHRGIDRKVITEQMCRKRFRPISLIDKSAVISKYASPGRCVQILAGAVIGPCVTSADFSILNIGACVPHGCLIGSRTHLALGVSLGGEVVIEADFFVGNNASTLPRCRIGRWAVVAAGAVVTKDVPPDTTVVGVQARPIVSELAY